MTRTQRTDALVFAAVALLAGLFVWMMPATAQDVRPPAGATTNAQPGAPAAGTAARPGGNFDVEMWRKVRGSVQGQVSIPDTNAGRLVDSSGEAWRAMRNGPLPTYGAWAMAGILALLSAFFLLRGRIRIEHGVSSETILRFTDIERLSHWLLAVSFIVLGLTGLNVLYGRYVLLPVMGKEAFASLSVTAKWLHNYVAFAFMLGLAMSFLLWVRHNIPHPRDLVWFAKGGGILFKGAHPKAKKFNAGQKILFWLVILGGVSLSLSGLQLMFPYELPLFAKTFATLNGWFGLALPTTLTPNQEQQYAALWHGIVALGLMCVILAHIYIGSVGMQGAFDAMGSGHVDLNWAKEHHSLWVEETQAAERRAPGARSGLQPAE